MTRDDVNSREVARAALELAMTASREEEMEQKQRLQEKSIASAACDYGGEFVQSIMRMVERAVVAAKREGLISECHHEEGAVAGAAREALAQIFDKALGFNVGWSGERGIFIETDKPYTDAD